MTEKMSEFIKAIQKRVASKELQANEASELLNKLSSLLGSINDLIVDKQMVYNRKLLDIMETEKTVNKGKLIAETTQEYSDLLQIKGQRETLMEMMRSLKYFIRIKEEEYREVRY